MSTRTADRAQAFDTLVERHLTGSYRLAAVILGDPAEAEDATHDALERAWNAWDSLRDTERFEAWFHRILVNTCRDRLRRRNGVTWVSVASQETHAGGIPASAEREALATALGGLSPDHRVVVAMRFFLDLPVDEIARRLNTRPGTVKSRLHYALRLLRAAYDAAERPISEAPR